MTRRDSTTAARPANSDAAAQTQAEINEEIAGIRSRFEATAGQEDQPRLDYAPYRSSVLRHPTKTPLHVDPETIELSAPVFGEKDIASHESDLTVGHAGAPVGERIIVTGSVIDGDGRPVRNQLVEVWQANAAGRYIHVRDQHPAPIDPNFTGVGRMLTDAEGRYRFTSIKPGPYPWRNHHNAWRPAHIHFSLFGTAFTERLVTQMYFPGDPLFDYDPIYQSVVDPAARARLVATYDHDLARHEWATGYRWDIVLTGVGRTHFDSEHTSEPEERP